MALGFGHPSIVNPIRPTNPIQRSFKFAVRSGMVDPNRSRKLVLEVKKKLEREHHALPVGKNGRDDEDMIYWFLKDRTFSVDDTVGKLAKAIKWRQEFQVSELSKELLGGVARTGKAYVHDFLDINNRPVLIVQHDPVQDEKLCVFLLEKAINK